MYKREKNHFNNPKADQSCHSSSSVPLGGGANHTLPLHLSASPSPLLITLTCLICICPQLYVDLKGRRTSSTSPLNRQLKRNFY